MESYEDVNSALEDVSNAPSGHLPASDPEYEDEAPQKPAMGPEERYEEVRQHGWTERVAIKYDEVTQTKDYDWAGGASRYEWQGTEGDIGPRNPELEEQLFKNILIPRAGHRIEE